MYQPTEVGRASAAGKDETTAEAALCRWKTGRPLGSKQTDEIRSALVKAERFLFEPLRIAPVRCYARMAPPGLSGLTDVGHAARSVHSSQHATQSVAQRATYEMQLPACNLIQTAGSAQDGGLSPVFTRDTT